MPHPCELIEEGMPGFEACQAAELAVAAGKVLGEAPAETVATLKETLIANAPVITERLNNALVKIGEWVEMTEEFAFGQAPLLAQEIIWWGVAEPGFRMGIGLLFLLCLPFTAFYLSRSKTMPEGKKCMGAALAEDGCGFDLAMAIAGGIVFPVTGLIVICCNAMAFLKPIVAPRVFLIEYFRAMAG